MIRLRRVLTGLLVWTAVYVVYKLTDFEVAALMVLTMILNALTPQAPTPEDKEE